MNARDAIMEYLKNREWKTAAEIAAGTNYSTSTVRNNLTLMWYDGAVIHDAGAPRRWHIDPVRT
jgi:DNA-binding IclR family transcriptional regulator